MMVNQRDRFKFLTICSLLALSWNLIEIHSFMLPYSPEKKVQKMPDLSRDNNLEFNEIGAMGIIMKDLKLSCTPSLQSSLHKHGSLCRSIYETDLKNWVERIGHFPFLQEAIERHPLLMARVLTSDKLHTAEYLLFKRAEVSSSQWSEKLSSNPPSRYRAKQLTLFLKSRLFFSPAEINKVIISQPKLFTYNVKKFEEVVDFLITQVPTPDVKVIVKRWPILLTYSVESRIKPGVIFLKSLGNTRWKRILVKYPQVLTHSVNTVLRPKLEYLAGLLNVRSAKNLVTNYPPLLWLSSDLIQRKFEFLKERLDLTQVEAEVLVETYPQILGLSIENNMMPKIEYLLLHLPPDQLREWALYQPAILAYSLNKRLIPRFEQLKAADIAISYSPKYLMSMTDSKFESWLSLQASSWTVIPDE